MNYSTVYALFDTAVTHRLKYPKIRLQDAQGQTVILKLSGSQSKYQGQLQITDDGQYPNNRYYGRIDKAGHFQAGRDSRPDILALLDRLAANPAQVASEYGKLTGNCCFCGLPLTDPQSTAVGYGPVCADHYGLPHGEYRATQIDTTPKFEQVPYSESFHGPDAFGRNTVESILADRSTPFWAIDVIKVALDKDAVDAANVLRVLAEAFDNRAQSLLTAQKG